MSVILQHGVVEAMFLFAVGERLHPIVVVAAAIYPAAVILYLDNYDAYLGKHHGVNLRILVGRFLDVQVVVDGDGGDAFFQQSQHKPTFGASAAAGVGDGAQQLSVLGPEVHAGDDKNDRCRNEY